MVNKLFRRSSSTLLLLLVTALLLSVVMPSMAQQGVAARPALSGVQVGKIADTAVRYPDGRISVIVTLADQPAVSAFALAGGRNNLAAANSAAATQRATVMRAQQAFGLQTAAVGADVVNRTSYLTNTVTLAVNPANLRALSQMAGVVAVQANQRYVLDNASSVPWIGADQVWAGESSILSATGADTVIAIIDTGIDYNHKLFGGEAAADADSTVLVGDEFGTAPFLLGGEQKVVGGWDFVGNDYNADIGTLPVPDEDPMDCNGHGSHVGGTAAGWGLLEAVVDPAAPTTTYAGPYDTTTYVGTDFKIGPGVAPEASLVALKVFGCAGSVDTAVVIAAIDAAASGVIPDPLDPMLNPPLAEFPVADVINMSLGSPFGTSSSDDVYSQAIDNAVTLADVITVASAGNNGNYSFITGSPGSANAAISVAASTDPSPTTLVSLEVTEVGSPIVGFIYEPILASFSSTDEFAIAADLVAAAINADAGDTTTPQGCAPFTNAADMVGNVAFVFRGGCFFATKAENAILAGAVGIIVANNRAGTLNMGGALADGFTPIPTAGITQAEGNELYANMPDGLAVSFDGVFGFEPEDEMAGFSSRGPSMRNEFSFKPDITAPGVTIVSAATGTGDGTLNIGGTSMAAPHIAGAMALLREANPGLSVADLKALIMNTATVDVVNSDMVAYGPQNQGAGRVDLVNALSNGVTAFNSANAAGVSVSFGFPEVIDNGAPQTFTESVTVENWTGAEVIYSVQYFSYTNAQGVSITTDASVTVAANSTNTFTVTLEVDPTDVNFNAASDSSFTVSTDPLSADFYRSLLTEEAGQIVLTPEITNAVGADLGLRVPVYAAPTANTDLVADSLALTNLGALAGVSTTVSVSGVDAATDPSIAGAFSVFELAGVDMDVDAVPAQVDLVYAGVASDYAASAAASTVENPVYGSVYFAIVTAGEWVALNEVYFDVYIDVDGDGLYDLDAYEIGWDQNTYVGAVNGYISDFWDAPTERSFLNGVFPTDSNTYLYNNNVVVIPADLEAWGVTGPFNYYVEAVDAETLLFDNIGSALEPMTFDPTAPAYGFGSAVGAPIFSGTQFPVDVLTDTTAYLPPVLALFHHNAFGSTYQVIDVTLDAAVDFATLSPIDGFVFDTLASLQNATAVTWEESAGAVTYDFALVDPNGFAVALVPALTPADDVEDTLDCVTTAGVCEFTLPGSLLDLLSLNGDYTWTVTAHNVDGSVSASAGFTVAVSAPGAFLATAPTGVFATEAEIEAVVNVTWGVSAEATSYDFVLTAPTAPDGVTSLFADFALTPEVDTDDLDCDATTCTLDITGVDGLSTLADLITDETGAYIYGNGDYVWGVTAHNFAGSTLVEASFTVGDTFAVVDPADGEIFTTFAGLETVTAIVWEEPAAAVSYDFTFGDVVTTDLTPVAGDDDLDCDGTICSLDISGVDGTASLYDLVTADGTYTWSVTPYNFAGEMATTTATFTVDFVAPSAFAVTAPADGLTHTTAATLPTVANWIDQTLTDVWYSVTITAPDTTTTEDVAGTLACNVGLCAFTGMDLLPFVVANGNGDYVLTISAGNFDSTVSVTRTFTVGDTFALLTPADATVFTSMFDLDAATAVTWQESADATAYVFTLTPPVGDPIVLSGLTPAADEADGLTCAAGTCTLTLTGSLLDVVTAAGNGSYSWDVVATNFAGTLSADAAFSFEVNVAAPVAFDLLTPATAGEFTSIAGLEAVTTLTWEESIDVSVYATSYAVSITDPASGVTPVMGTPICDGTTCTLTLAGSLLDYVNANGAYSWTVVASNFAGTTNAAVPFTFTVNVPVPGVFTLTSPVGNIFTNPTDIAAVTSLVWTDALDATSYAVTFTGLDLVEVPVLGTPVCVDGVCTLTITALPVTLNGTYSWEVTASNFAGDTVATGSFTVAVPAPATFALLSPADGTFVEDPAGQLAAITWEASAAGYAPDYIFTLIKVDNDWTRALGVVHELELTSDICVEGVCTLALPAEVLTALTQGQYLWFVQAVDAYQADYVVDASNASFGFTVNVGDIELVMNGNFQLNADGILKKADLWTTAGTTNLDKVACELAPSTNCAFRFGATVGVAERSRLIQSTLLYGVDAGDTLKFSAAVNGKASNVIQFRITVSYLPVNGVTPTASNFKLNAKGAGATAGYDTYLKDVIVGANAVKSIKIQVIHTSLSGKHFVDNISLLKLAGAQVVAPPAGLLPLPESAGN